MAATSNGCSLGIWMGGSFSFTASSLVPLPTMQTDYVLHPPLVYKTPRERAGWQMQDWPAEAHSLGEEKNHGPGLSTTWLALSGELTLPVCLQNQLLLYLSRPTTCLSQLLFRTTPLFSFSTCNKESVNI